MHRRSWSVRFDVFELLPTSSCTLFCSPWRNDVLSFATRRLNAENDPEDNRFRWLAEGCEDVDDALSCEQLDNGNFRIGVVWPELHCFLLNYNYAVKGRYFQTCHRSKLEAVVLGARTVPTHQKS